MEHDCLDLHFTCAAPTDNYTHVCQVPYYCQSCIFFVLSESSTYTCSTRKTDTVWGTHSHVRLLQPRPYFISQKGSLDTVNPERTDIACLQLCWMMGQVLRRLLLKRCTDFPDRVLLKCKRNTLINLHVWTWMSTCVKSGTGNITSGLERCMDTRAKQKRFT